MLHLKVRAFNEVIPGMLNAHLAAKVLREVDMWIEEHKEG